MDNHTRKLLGLTDKSLQFEEEWLVVGQSLVEPLGLRQWGYLTVFVHHQTLGCELVLLVLDDRFLFVLLPELLVHI